MLTCNKLLILIGLSFTTQYVFAQSNYAPTSVDMEVKKVSEHVYYVEGIPGIATDNEGFISNAGFIVTNDGVVVFDSLGTPSLANKLVQKIKLIRSEERRVGKECRL